MTIDTLDAYDKRILAELDRDSRSSLRRLSKMVRKSKQFVKYRIGKMEKLGIIKGYKAIVDMSKLGFFTYRFYVKMQQLTRPAEQQFMNYLMKDERIWEVARIHGKWDFAVFIGVKSVNELQEAWQNIVSIFKPKILSYEFVVYSPVYFFNRRFFADREEEIVERVYGIGKEEKYDALDFEIIKNFADNARQPLTQVAEKCHVTIDTVIKRIRKMEKNKIIVGYKLDLDVEALGFVGYRVDLYLSSTRRNEELFNYCKNHKNIYLVIKSIGGGDWEMTVVVKNFYELLKIMDEMQQKFNDVIKNYEYFNFSTYHRLTYIPD